MGFRAFFANCCRNKKKAEAEHKEEHKDEAKAQDQTVLTVQPSRPIGSGVPVTEGSASGAGTSSDEVLVGIDQGSRPNGDEAGQSLSRGGLNGTRMFLVANPEDPMGLMLLLMLSQFQSAEEQITFENETETPRGSKIWTTPDYHISGQGPLTSPSLKMVNPEGTIIERNDPRLIQAAANELKSMRQEYKTSSSHTHVMFGYKPVASAQTGPTIAVTDGVTDLRAHQSQASLPTARPA